jgi:rod shape-determining protein MreB and related proteins
MSRIDFKWWKSMHSGTLWHVMFDRFTPKVGIDLGTTSVLVFVPGQGIVLNEPSVVAVGENNQVLAVGAEAKRMIGRTPESIRAYRPMKDGVIADYRVTEAMLRYFLGKALSRYNIFKPDVMVSVPAGVTSTERRAVVEATIKAGARNAYVVKEPILAAIGAGVPIYEPQGHMIVDIGGGTIDVAVISLGGIVLMRRLLTSSKSLVTSRLVKKRLRR